MLRRSQRNRHLQGVRNAMMHIPVQLMQCDRYAKIFYMLYAFNPSQQSKISCFLHQLLRALSKTSLLHKKLRFKLQCSCIACKYN